MQDNIRLTERQDNIRLTETDKTTSDLQRQIRQHQTYRDRQDNIRLTETGKTTSDLQSQTRQTRQHQTYRDRQDNIKLTETGKTTSDLQRQTRQYQTYRYGHKLMFFINKAYHYIVINIFLLISMENNRATYPCICTLLIKSILH
jgi:hypothetical protein